MGYSGRLMLILEDGRWDAELRVRESVKYYSGEYTIRERVVATTGGNLSLNEAMRKMLEAATEANVDIHTVTQHAGYERFGGVGEMTEYHPV